MRGRIDCEKEKKVRKRNRKADNTKSNDRNKCRAFNNVDNC